MKSQHHNRDSLSARLAAAVIAGKLTGAASRVLGKGGGTALPGLVSERIDPAVVQRLAAQIGHGSILVTGTNGKTTTARLLTGAVRESGYLPINNASGSNLMRGVATELVSQADAVGRLRHAGNRLGVFEVDEATVPHAAALLKPRAILFTNLFRDQLDRYGEVDSVAGLWRRFIKTLPESTVIVLNADDPGVASLAPAVRGRLIYYGVNEVSSGSKAQEHASDARWCPTCDVEYEYHTILYGHLGHWYCPKCKRERPEPQVFATRVEAVSPSQTAVDIETPQGSISSRIALIGLYNAYNAIAAAAGAVSLDLPAASTERAIAAFSPVFGRQESIDIDGKNVQVLLGKNPSGMNQVIRTLATLPGPKHLYMLLNDGIADGTDVSWVWDVDYEALVGQIAHLTVAGTRPGELALRLQYANVGDMEITDHIEQGLRKALDKTPVGGTLFIVPTYTAMLNIREILTRWGKAPHYWEDGR